ncbi:MAG: hypothetical protein ACXQS2_01520 [Methermicoccaceae archaeon]
MKAVVKSCWTFSSTAGKVWELGEEIEKAVKEFINSGKERDVKELDGKFLELLRGKDGEVILRFYYLTTTNVLLDDNYIRRKYGDFLRFIAEKGFAKRKEIDKEFHIHTDGLIKQCKEIGLIESSRKGYTLTKKGMEVLESG